MQMLLRLQLCKICECPFIRQYQKLFMIISSQKTKATMVIMGKHFCSAAMLNTLNIENKLGKQLI